jgi:hypothetical protein
MPMDSYRTLKDLVLLAEPNKHANEITRVPADADVIETGSVVGALRQVEYNGFTGWIEKAYLKKLEKR